MRRLAVAPRPDLALRAEALGFTLYREGGLRNYSTHPRMVQHIWEMEPAP